MSSGDKTGDKLVASIRKTKVGTQSATSESTSSPNTETAATKPRPASKTQAKKTAPSKPRPKAKSQPKKPAPRQPKETGKQDPFTVGRRVWPD